MGNFSQTRAADKETRARKEVARETLSQHTGEGKALVESKKNDNFSWLERKTDCKGYRYNGPRGLRVVNA